MPPLDKLIPGTIGAALLGTVLFLSGRTLLKAFASRRWPAVEGRITRSEISFKVRGRNFDAEKNRFYTANIAYEYFVDGVACKGTRTRFGSWLDTTGKTARELVRKYHAGTPVMVRYNPRKPQESTLETRPSFFVWLAFGLGSLIALLVISNM